MTKKSIWIMTVLIGFFILASVVQLMTTRNPESSSQLGDVFDNRPGIGILNISGPITFSGEAGNILGPVGGVESWIHQLNQLEKNKNVKALIVRINSPGGTVGSSQELYQAIQSFKRAKQVPVVASIGDMGASGAYWTALAADEIVANSGSLIGSIGVILGGYEMSGLMEKLGIKANTIKSGPYKDIMSPSREMTDEERLLLQSVVDDVYQQFRTVVSQRRGFHKKELDLLADGQIFTGRQAAMLGLIDREGTLKDVVDTLSDEIGIKNPPLISPEKNPFQQFVELWGGQLSGALQNLFLSQSLFLRS